MQSILPLFEDPAAKVREVLGWLFARLGEFHPGLFDEEGAAAELFPRLIKLLLDRPRVSRQACLALEKIADANLPTCNERPSNCLSPFFGQIMDTLVQNS